MKNNSSLFFVIGQLGGGGSEKQLFYLIRDILKTNENVFLFVWNSSNKDLLYLDFFNLLKQKLIFIPKKSLPLKILSLIKHVRSVRPEYLISFSLYTNFICWIVGLIIGTRTIGSLRSSARYSINNDIWISKLGLRYPKTILVNSKIELPFLKQQKFLRNTEYKYFSNVIDLSFYKSSLQIKSNKQYTSLSIGTIKEEKRIDRLFQYVQLASQKINNFRHIHLGGGINLESVKNQSRILKLEKYLDFIGETPYVIKWMSDSKVFVHFSDFEGTPNVIMEAMAASLPIVTTDCGDVKTFIENEVSGYIVEPFSDIAFVNHVSSLINNRNLYLNISESAFNTIIQFDINGYSKRFLSLIQDTDN